MIMIGGDDTGNTVKQSDKKFTHTEGVIDKVICLILDWLSFD